MSAEKMHADEVYIDSDLVRELISGQFPEYADLPIEPVTSTGTVNAIYRLGDELYARLPRVEGWERDLDRELRWLPQLAPRLSLQIPEPVGKGDATGSYPFSWAIYRWIEGRPYSDDLIDYEARAARDLAEFVIELRSIETSTDAPRGGRKPLRDLDAETRASIEASRGVIEVDTTAEAWESALEAPMWEGTPVWIHADLMKPNVLVRGGRISAVIDFGAVGVGDPASDVIPAWEVFGPVGRETFRSVLDVDDGAWNRARGYALHQAAMIIPYYATTNPQFVELARHTIEEVVSDHRRDA